MPRDQLLYIRSLLHPNRPCIQVVYRAQQVLLAPSDHVISLSAAIHHPGRVPDVAEGLHKRDPAKPGACCRADAVNLPNVICRYEESCVMQPSNLFAFGAQYFAEKRSQSTVETKQEEPEAAAAEQEPRASAFERAAVAENYQELSEAVYGKAVDLLCIGLCSC